MTEDFLERAKAAGLLTDDDMALNRDDAKFWADAMQRSTKSNIDAALRASHRLDDAETERLKRAIVTGAIAACVEVFWTHKPEGWTTQRCLESWMHLGGAYFAQFAAGAKVPEKASGQ